MKTFGCLLMQNNLIPVVKYLHVHQAIIYEFISPVGTLFQNFERFALPTESRETLQTLPGHIYSYSFA
jgi:hypothetical protein